MAAAEKLLNEIDGNIEKGKSYTAKTARGIFGAARHISSGILGQRDWRLCQGKWISVKVKPGLVDVIRSLRR